MILDTSEYIFIDHHAHSVFKTHLELDALSFRQCFSETRSVAQLRDHLPWSAHYMDLIQHLGQLLVADDEDGIIQFRSSRKATAYTRLLWDKASIGALLIDDGYKKQEMLELSNLARLSGRPIYHVKRIETVIEELILEQESFQDLLDVFESRLLAAGDTKLVALKSIASYRGGLNISVPSLTQAKTDFTRIKRQVDQEKKCRIDARPLYHFLLASAFEIAGKNNLPVQIHTGLGDDDALLPEANPACMQPILRSQTYRDTNFVFLHCYPFVRDASYLASIYANVYVDLSLSVQLASPLSVHMLREMLALAPFTKVLAASDGHSIPEAHWWGSFCWRRALNNCLGQMVTEKFLHRTDAEHAAALILHGNAKNLYNLPGLI